MIEPDAQSAYPSPALDEDTCRIYRPPAPAETRPDPMVHLVRIARERPLRVGVLSGLGYTNLKGDLARTTEHLRTLPHVPHRVVKTPPEVGAALDEFAASAIDVVAVSGGDGTVSMVVTQLLARPATAQRPVIALLEGGRTNMTAGDVGIRGNQIKALKKLVRRADNRELEGTTLLTRTVLGVGSPGKPPACGFFVGGGAIYQGSLETWSFRDKSRLPGMTTGLGTAASVVKLVAAHVISRSAFAPSRLELTMDGETSDETSWCVVFATTLQRMAMGIFPFWAESEGAIRLTAVAHKHRHLLRAALPGLRGKSSRHLSSEYGYHSHNANHIDIKLEDGLTLDGEIIRPDHDILRLRVAGEVTFIRP